MVDQLAVPITLETKRLRLRQWREEDKGPFADLCADQDVMQYFPNTLSTAESNAMVDRSMALIAQQGWGLWATELKASQTFIGFVGLIALKPQYFFAPGVEIGWRLARDYWGRGYATEAARTVLQFGFDILNLDEIVALTAVGNLRSRAVMQRLGMVDTRNNFRHPAITEDHPLAEHALYKITRHQRQQPK